jgi:hypothetical protein
MSSGRAYIRAGEFFFLGSMSRDSEPIQLNSNIAVTCEILKVIPASMAEAKLGTLLVNRKEPRIIRPVEVNIGHLQPPTPMHIDNTTTVGILNNTSKRQRSRSMEIIYF